MRLLGLMTGISLLLCGCSTTLAPPSDTAFAQGSAQERLHARVDPEQYSALQQALAHKGLLLPSLMLTEEATLAPDYPLSAVQWASLQQRLGLQLEDPNRSLQRYRYLLRAINARCPEQARRASAGCKALGLIGLESLAGNGALDAEELTTAALGARTRYLIISNPQLYTEGLMRHAQSGLTTRPLTRHSSEERRDELHPALTEARLEFWLPDATEAAFSCHLNATAHTPEQWHRLQKDLLGACEPALVALLGLELNDTLPSLSNEQQQKLEQLLQKKDALFQQGLSL